MARVSKKIEKKVISTSLKVRCPLAIMSSFSQNCFLLIPIMVSSSSEIALTKKYCFHHAENPFALAGRRSLKNTFPVCGKAASTLRNLWKNWCPLTGIWFVFKNGLPPNFNNSFHFQKKTRNKTIDKTDKNVSNMF